MDKKVVTDFLGNEIKVGSEIVYPGRKGANLWMNYAIVTQVTDTGKVRVQRVASTFGREQAVWIDHVKRVVVVR